MKRLIVLTLSLIAAVVAPAQQDSPGIHAGADATTMSGISNLPMVTIGANDLIGVTVYDAPELTRTVRVNSIGDIRLPMLKQPIHAAGLYPESLQSAIAAALTKEDVLVDPIVTATIVESQSRPITIIGSVRNTMTYQAVGNATLLDAISRAGGLTENAGTEILVSSQAPGEDGKSKMLLRRISTSGLLNGTDPSLNLSLQGGEIIRVPEAGKIYVMGEIKKPGFFYVKDASDATVMKAVAISEGLGAQANKIAFIYRNDPGSPTRHEIRVELRKIMDRKSPDIALNVDDIFYIPDATGRKVGLTILQSSIPIMTAIGTTFIYLGR